MKKETKTSRILNLLDKNPELGHRADYIAEQTGIDRNTIYPLLEPLIKKGSIEKLKVTNKEVYYIKSN